MTKGIAGLLSSVMLAGAWPSAPALAQNAPPPTPPPYAAPGYPANAQPNSAPAYPAAPAPAYPSSNAPNYPANTAPGNLPPGTRYGSPAVARVSVIDRGSMLIQRADSQKQVPGTVNAPLLPGDFVSTGASTRVELQLDGYTMVRLGSNVQARIVKNERASRKVQLAAGTVEVAVLHEDEGITDIDTPSVTIQIAGEGNYRITVGTGGGTTATARTGKAIILGAQQRYELVPGQTFAATGPASNPRVISSAEIGYDAFDDFNAARDKVLFAAIATDSNVPPSISGYDNLNQYGRWANVAPYGNVWIPNVGADWAPYRNGQWTWETGFGWVWVGNEPWGWVPYHYGRWFYANGYGWAWVPPAPAVGDDQDQAPAWYPAQVGFFGYGDDSLLSFAAGFAFFGWVPLAPFEPYYPWYPAYYGYNGYNHGGYYPPRYPGLPGRTGTHWQPRRPIGQIYRNAAFHGATSVGANGFHEGDFSHATAVDPARLDPVSPMRGELPLKPTEANLSFARPRETDQVPLSPAFNQPRFASEFSFPALGAPVARQPESLVRGETATQGAWGQFDQARGTSLAPQARQPESGLPAQGARDPVERDPVERDPVERDPVERDPTTGHIPYPMAHPSNAAPASGGRRLPAVPSHSAAPSHAYSWGSPSSWTRGSAPANAHQSPTQSRSPGSSPASHRDRPPHR